MKITKIFMAVATVIALTIGFGTKADAATKNLPSLYLENPIVKSAENYKGTVLMTFKNQNVTGYQIKFNQGDTSVKMTVRGRRNIALSGIKRNTKLRVRTFLKKGNYATRYSKWITVRPEYILRDIELEPLMR